MTNTHDPRLGEMGIPLACGGPLCGVDHHHPLCKLYAPGAVSTAPAAPVSAEPVAWVTHHDEPMLFPTEAEAQSYCDDDEQPIPLYEAPVSAEPMIEATVCGYTPGQCLVELRLPAGWRLKGLALELGDAVIISAAPVAAQPDLTQQTLDDVMAGIPARDAEIEALRKQVETLQAQLVDRSPEMQGTPVDESPNLQSQQQPVSGAEGLPPLPRGISKHSVIGHDADVYTDAHMVNYARAALAQQDADKVELDWQLIRDTAVLTRDRFAGLLGEDPSSEYFRVIRKRAEDAHSALLSMIDAARKEQA